MQIIKVPGFSSKLSEGCKDSGNALLKYLKKLSFNESGKSTEEAFLNLEEIHLNNFHFAEKDKLISENALNTFEEQDRVIFLGGDHSISFSIIKSFLIFCNSKGREPSLIVFDACVDGLSGGNDLSKSWLREIISLGFPSENILLVGVRSISPSEEAFLKLNHIKRISLNCFLEDIASACDSLMEFSSGRLLYLSFDFNSLDPVFMPYVRDIIPGGFSSRQMIYLFQRIKKIKSLLGVDFVGLNSGDKKEEGPLALGAKLLFELL